MFKLLHWQMLKQVQHDAVLNHVWYSDRVKTQNQKSYIENPTDQQLIYKLNVRNLKKKSLTLTACLSEKGKTSLNAR